MVYKAAIVLMALAAAPAVAADGGGQFTGLNGHAASGSVTLVKGDSGWEVRLGEDFSFDGAPDPWLGFGARGEVMDRAIVYRLRANSGAQRYKVPPDIDPAAYDELYIWCRRYAMPLGVAQIAR